MLPAEGHADNKIAVWETGQSDLFASVAARRVIKLGAMKVDLSIWDKLTRVVIFLLFVAGILLVAIWYLPLIRENERYRQRLLELDTQVQKEQETVKQLRTSIDALRHDPKAVERLARQQLRYAKPGEIVVRFEQPPTNNTARK